jgi:hypothetical protein
VRVRGLRVRLVATLWQRVATLLVQVGVLVLQVAMLSWCIVDEAGTFFCTPDGPRTPKEKRGQEKEVGTCACGDFACGLCEYPACACGDCACGLRLQAHRTVGDDVLDDVDGSM